MLSAAYVLNFVGMILLPILLGIWLVRKFKLSWKLLLAGALTFIASQVLHIPLVYGLTAAFKNGILPSIPQAWALLFNAVLLGLLAGIFEETARYILFKFVLKNTRSWEQGLLVGVGHGGIEAILLGFAATAAFLTMLGYRSVDLSTLPSIPADQLDLARQQVTAYWSAALYMPFLGLVERVSAVSLHISLSVMVLYSIVRRQPLWFWLALLWHAFVDAVAVYFLPKIGAVPLEAVLLLMAAFSLWILFFLRPRFAPAEQVPAASTVAA
jgi:uncharacterized membrane protein YhfC